MTSTDEEDVVACVDCGAPTSVGLERGYAFSPDGVLCWQCAQRRGGSFDEAEERWAVVPATDDLQEEPG